jgi:hypothetical protein
MLCPPLLEKLASSEKGTLSSRLAFTFWFSRTTTKSDGLKWTDSAIRLLIDLRIKLDSQFKSTTAKNEVVWKIVAGEMKKQHLPHSAMINGDI